MDTLEKIRSAGIVGAGGAGFPTHVKLDCRADTVIANGAECEPLLRVDQQLMEISAGEIVEGLQVAIRQVGANEGVIFLKSHYDKAVEALSKEIRHKKNIRLFVSESFYPAGDEQQIIYEVTRRIVPPGGLPKDVGCVVCNVSTLYNISAAMRDIPVTERYVTVAGAVARPCTLLMPLGAPMAALLERAGGLTQADCAYIVGGPCMGAVANTPDGVVTKTTGGLLAIPNNHPLLTKRSSEMRYNVMLSVCCQCSMCTQMCPRQALGLGTSPHKAMRSLAAGTDLIGDVNAILTCCDCGVCTTFACNFGLNPALVMNRMKQALMEKGMRPNPDGARQPDFFIDDKRLSTGRLITRLGLEAYDVPAPIDTKLQHVPMVRIPLRMHIGAASRPLVCSGQRVQRGDLIAEPPKGAMGANIHASIDGTITHIADNYIEIKE